MTASIHRLTSAGQAPQPPPEPPEPTIGHEHVTTFNAFYMNITHGTMADGSAKLTLGIPADHADAAWLTRAEVGYTLRITVEKQTME